MSGQVNHLNTVPFYFVHRGHDARQWDQERTRFVLRRLYGLICDVDGPDRLGIIRQRNSEISIKLTRLIAEIGTVCCCWWSWRSPCWENDPRRPTLERMRARWTNPRFLSSRVSPSARLSCNPAKGMYKPSIPTYLCAREESRIAPSALQSTLRIYGLRGSLRSLPEC